MMHYRRGAVKKSSTGGRGGRVPLALVWAVALIPALLAAEPAHAFPVRARTAWSDSFDSNWGVSTLDRVKVAGGSLKLAEGEPVDLGEAVPGETSVYSLLGTSLGASSRNVYCGTGEKGHLVEHNPDELYQEAYQGPTHYGVSNSRGQAVTSTDPPQARVMALTQDGSLVYGGTAPDGHLFSFDPASPGNPCRDLGGCPGAAGAVLSLTHITATVYGGTESGHAFSYSGGFSNLGQPSGSADPLNAVAASGAVLFLGSENGHIYSYDTAGPGAFVDLGQPSGSSAAILSLGTWEAVCYAGSRDGHLYRYNGGGPGDFTDLGRPSGEDDPVNAVVVKGTDVYAGSENGRLYTYTGFPGSFNDLGAPPGTNSAPIGALTLGADGLVYGGTLDDGGQGGGRLFRESAYEDHGSPEASPLSAISYCEKKIFLGNSAGNLYTYTGPATYNYLGSADGTAINDLDSKSGMVYMAMESGSLYRYKSDDPVPFLNLGSPASPPTGVRAVRAVSISLVFLGLADGRIYQYSGEGFKRLDPDPQVESAVTDLLYLDDTLYVAYENGHLYRYDASGPEYLDLGNPSGGSGSLNALASYGGAVFAGSGDGHLYRYNGGGPGDFSDLGDCGNPVSALADGLQGVLAGTLAGDMFAYDTELRPLGGVPGFAAVRSLTNINGFAWGGTGTGGLFSHEGSYLADLGRQVKAQIMIWCSAYDRKTGLFYAGTYRNAHFLIINASTGKVIDRGRPVNGERELEDILVASDGQVYGCTYGGTEEFHNPAGGHVFIFDPADMAFTDLGEPPGDDNWWVTSLIEGPPTAPLIYGATSNSTDDRIEGRFFSIDPHTHAMTDLGVPVPGQGTRSLAVWGDRVYGGTWDHAIDEESSVYYYDTQDPQHPGFIILGEPPLPPSGVRANMHINRLLELGGVIYGAQNNGYLFSFDPNQGYQPRVLGKPEQGAESVFPLEEGDEGTLICGTSNSRGGHLVNYDPALDGFRDVATPLASYQVRVSALAYAAKGPAAGITMGGTYGKQVGADRVAGRIFTMARYLEGMEASAVSADVVPGLRDLGRPVADPSQESVGALCAGPRGAKVVYGGTANPAGGPDARLFMFSTMTGQVTDTWSVPAGHKQVKALCAGGNYIYGGTANDQSGPDAVLFRFDPARGTVENLGVPLAGAKGIFALAAAGNGRIYIGTGDRKEGESYSACRMVEYNPASGQFTDKGAVGSGQGRLAALTLHSNGWIYGGTAVSPGQTGSANFLKYNPSTGYMRVLVPAEFGTEQSMHSVASGPGNTIYCGTGPSGRLVSYDVSGDVFAWESEGWPYPNGSAVTALASTSEMVTGCAGERGNLFRFTPGEGYVDMGPATYGNSGVGAATTDNLGKPHFGSSGDERLVRYDPAYRFVWGEAAFTRTHSPPVTEARIDIAGESGASLPDYQNIESPFDISGVDPAANPGLRLKGWLSSSDPEVTPGIGEWRLTWEERPGIDEVYPARAYRGDLIYIWGSNFGDSAGTVTVDGQPASVGLWTDSMVQVTVPQAATAGKVVVTAGGHSSNTGSFLLLEPPRLDSVSPSKGHVGDTVELRGCWFLDSRGAGDSVSFNGVVASYYQSWSDSSIKVRVPQGATSGPVMVSVNGHLSNTKNFTVLPGGGPQVEITRPLDGETVWGRAAVEARVTGSDIDRVEFMVDGRLQATDKAPPYAFSWETGTVAVDGGHQVVAQAVDGAGRRGTDGVILYTDRTVPRPSTHWYFAEGCTDYGFETWLLVQNPEDQEGMAYVTFMDEAGYSFEWSFELPPRSRTTINAGDWVPNASISTEVRADHPVICERAMYWNGRLEGHGSVGATSLANEWYSAEGCTDYGFETFVLLGNPGEAEVTANLQYMFPGGGTASTSHVLGPRSRLTVNTDGEVGNAEFSVRVTASSGVVAERAMYSGYRRCGTETIGARAPSLDWFLSEGCTDYGFETWLLIQRPDEGDASVRATYHLGSGDTVEKVYTVPGRSRFTVDVFREVGAADVSTRISSNQPVICERAMYWNSRSAGHVTVGAAGSGTEWRLAEGCTDYGFETWILLDNPWESATGLTMRFMKQDGENAEVYMELPPRSRVSVDAGAYVPFASFATEVKAAAPVMCERAMYWNSRSGGTGSIGAR